MAVDFTHSSPSATNAYTAEFESRVRIGTAQHFAALAVSGSTYVAAYDYASVGLQAGLATDLGQLASPPSVEPTVTFEEVFQRYFNISPLVVDVGVGSNWDEAH